MVNGRTMNDERRECELCVSTLGRAWEGGSWVGGCASRGVVDPLQNFRLGSTWKRTVQPKPIRLLSASVVKVNWGGAGL